MIGFRELRSDLFVISIKNKWILNLTSDVSCCLERYMPIYLLKFRIDYLYLPKNMIWEADVIFPPPFHPPSLYFCTLPKQQRILGDATLWISNSYLCIVHMNIQYKPIRRGVDVVCFLLGTPCSHGQYVTATSSSQYCFQVNIGLSLSNMPQIQTATGYAAGFFINKHSWFNTL